MKMRPVHVNALPLPRSFAFENVSEDTLGKNMEWRGSVSAAFDRAQAINAGHVSLEDGFWSPARIVRAVIDSKVRGPERVELISLATEVALLTYAGASADGQLKKLKHGLTSANLLDMETAQTADFTSSGACAADLSKAASARISDKLPAAPLFMVALCHGGLVASLQTALYSAQRHDMTVYPVRSSMRKHGDRGLFLPDGDEIHHITALSKGKEVVVHDEDASGGRTVHQARNSLRILIGRTDILGVVSLDGREKRTLERQGEWWEKA